MVVCLHYATVAHAGDWVTEQDISEGDSVHRIEMRSSSIRRNELYSVFEQRMMIGTKRKPRSYDERHVIAMNCYTGRWGRVFVGVFELETDEKPQWKNEDTITEIDATGSVEWGAKNMNMADALKSPRWKFACSCDAAAKTKQWPAIALDRAKNFHQEKIVPLPREKQVHVGYIRVADQPLAQKIIEALKKGEDFGALADQYSEAKEFPRGIISWQPESSYFGKSRQILRSLKPNAFHPHPIEGFYGWEVWKLLDMRVDPLRSFEESRHWIETYLGNQDLCAIPPR